MLIILKLSALYGEYCYLSVIMLSVVVLTDFMLSVMASTITMRIIMLNFVYWVLLY
jgi:hypothetical protein